MEEKTTSVDSAVDVKADRRGFMKGAAIALGAGAVGALTPSSAGAVTAELPVANAEEDSLLQKIISTKKIRFGVDLGFPPLQYKTSNGTPTGYIVDLSTMLATSLGATIEWVEVPFANLFAQQAAGRFDMSGISATIRPDRAQRVLFAGAPSFVESNVVLLKPGAGISRLSQLNSSSVTIAVVVGSSQEAAAKILYPRATLKRLTNQEALADVAAGRSDCMIVGEFSVAGAIKANPNVKVLKGDPVFVDENSYFMPLGEHALKHYVDTWLRYQTSHNELGALWDKYIGDDARKLGLKTVSIYSPWKGK
ncbi:MAG: substrate-binding periplasmic protein [Actinomycetota bacterium]